MLSRTKGNARGERLDEVAEDLVRAARASDAEIEAAGASPLLYSRIRSSIAARRRESESSTGWLVFLRAARLAIPAMALATVVVTCLPRLAMPKKHRATSIAAYQYRPTPPSPDPARAPLILTLAASACALSNAQECAISDNEVLATIFADDNQEKQQ